MPAVEDRSQLNEDPRHGCRIVRREPLEVIERHERPFHASLFYRDDLSQETSGSVMVNHLREAGWGCRGCMAATQVAPRIGIREHGGCMKRIMLVGVVVFAAACDSGAGRANGNDLMTPGVSPTASSVSATPAFVTVTGALSTSYLTPQRTGCADISIRGIEGSLARDHVKYVEGKTIDFRSSSEAVRYSATTPTSADLIGTGRKLGRFDVCLALDSYA